MKACEMPAATNPLRIALIGAESTGKTQLSTDLAAHFQRLGYAVHQVSEQLRVWCDEHGRTPWQHEQQQIAQNQADAALQGWHADVLIADTTPLMVAVYSDVIFGDASLYEAALAHQRRYDITLLLAPDLPWVADGFQRDGAHVRAPVDALLRAALRRADLDFYSVSGSGPLRLAAALAAIERAQHWPWRLGVPPEELSGPERAEITQPPERA